MSLQRGATGALICLAFLEAAPAQAHVKWFAPYIVGAPPQPISSVLANPWFWIGILLVILFFVLTRLVEISPLGDRVHDGLDRSTGALYRRLDDYIRGRSVPSSLRYSPSVAFI
ncbi:hypothetical protein [Rhizobium wenxiniae]|uniref:hypothetical protein n=1 Tax=Rhizobium wenxiniae TaxID=1737357 RepID=UPI001CB77145|nr:hypothetical protein [Rhizobium wenxiniae]